VKKRILHVIDHTNSGGAQVVVFNLIRALHDEYFLAVAVIGKSGIFTESFRKLGVPVYELGNNLSKWNPLGIIALRRLMRKERFDLIHTHLFKSNILGILAAHWIGIKTILHDHTGIYPQSLRRLAINRLMLPIFLAIHRVSHKLCDCVIVLTREMYLAYEKFYSSNESKMELLPNGIDIQQYEHSYQVNSTKALRQELNLPAETKFIAMIGRLEIEKDWRTFLRVAQALQQNSSLAMAFLVIGTGTLEASLRRYVVENKVDKVYFLGYRNDIYNILRQADIFMLTSCREPFGLVVLEAMLAKCPVIATRSGGPEAIIDNGKNGLLQEIGDVQGIAESAIRLMSDETMRRNIVQAGLRTVHEMYALQTMVRRMAAIYERLLSPLIFG
jgi:glycosyltransferase involved in cell wall biosynthesis